MKIKKVLLGIAAFAFSMNAFSQGIEFEHGTFDEALAKAKAENKMVFMDCYTVWCAPCKRLANEVFPLKEVGDYFNANFVSIKMDMEKGEGVELKKKYGVSVFPTLLWIDTEGNLIHKVMGSRSPDALIEDAKTANNPEKNWARMDEKFKNGEHNITFLQDYIFAASKLRVDTKEAAKLYYAQRKTEELLNVTDLKLLLITVESISDEKFSFVLKNRENFNELAGKADIDKFISEIMTREMFATMRLHDETAYENKKKELLAIDETVANKIFPAIDMGKSMKEDPNKLFGKLADFSLKNNFDEPQLLNKLAVKILKTSTRTDFKQELWEKVLKIAKRLVELKADYQNTDIYAHVLYKAGQIEEAKKVAEQSVKLVPEDKKKDLWAFKYLNGEL